MRDVSVVSEPPLNPIVCEVLTLQIEPEWLYELAPHFYHYGTVRVALL